MILFLWITFCYHSKLFYLDIVIRVSKFPFISLLIKDKSFFFKDQNLFAY